MSLILRYDNNLDDYGYYKVGEEKFLVKNEALMHASKTGGEVYWNFNDEHFSTFDWQEEPTKTLAQLYAERAMQLRQKYDYIVLHFSGGADSLNIVSTCIRNNIHIDEFILRGPNLNDYDVPRGHDAYDHYAEIKHFAYPLAKIIKDTYMPNLKITVSDIVPFTVEWFSKERNWFDQFPWINDPSALNRNSYDVLNPELIKMAEMGKKVLHLTGHDKPRVHKAADGSYYLNFTDGIFSRHISPRVAYKDLPYYIEFFYWHKDATELMIKQAHVVMRAEKQGKLSLHRTPVPSNEKDLTLELSRAIGKERRLNEDAMSAVIYDYPWPIKWQSYKPFIKNITEEHYWIYEHEGSNFFQNWKRGMAKLHFKVDKRFHRNGDLFKYGTREYESKNYKIG